MDYPVIFPLRETLARCSADRVRQILQQNGFRQHPTAHTPYSNPKARGFSEIWSKLAGRGYAVVRIDTQGHARLGRTDDGAYEIQGASGTHAAVPHFHKEWIAADLFPRYLNECVPQVVRYTDAGDPVIGPMTDAKAKETHIRQ